jgi:hypothetical protein
VLGRLSFDHDDPDRAILVHAAADDEIEDALVHVGIGGERDPRAVAVSEAKPGERPFERETGQHGRQRRAGDRERVVGVDVIDREDGHDDLNLVAHALGERGTQRPVDEPAQQRRILGGTTFTAEEAAGELADGVHALFDIDGQGEEVEAFARMRAGGGGDEHLGFADGREDRASGELGEATCFETERDPRDLAFEHVRVDGLRHGSLLCEPTRRGCCRVIRSEVHRLPVVDAHPRWEATTENRARCRCGGRLLVGSR